MPAATGKLWLLITLSASVTDLGILVATVWSLATMTLLPLTALTSVHHLHLRHHDHAVSIIFSSAVADDMQTYGLPKRERYKPRDVTDRPRSALRLPATLFQSQDDPPDPTVPAADARARIAVVLPPRSCRDRYRLRLDLCVPGLIPLPALFKTSSIGVSLRMRSRNVHTRPRLHADHVFACGVTRNML